MPFQIANREATKGNHRRPKLFRDALLVAIKEADAEGVEALYHVAKALVAEAKAGNVLANADAANLPKPPAATGNARDKSPYPSTQSMNFRWPAPPPIG